MLNTFKKDQQYIKFCLYGFLKNLRFYDAFLLVFLIDNNISFSQIGILYASREIITNLVEIPSGIMADTYGRKNALIVAFLSYILSYIVFYYSSRFNLLLIAMLLIGVGDAFRSGTHKGMIMDYLRHNDWGDQKINYYGHTRSWSQLGSALSALFAGLMVFYSGNYRVIYLVAIIPYVINFINIYTYPDFLNHSLKINQDKRAGIITVLSNSFAALKKKNVLKIINSAALHSAFLKSCKDYIQPLMIQIGIVIPFFTSIESTSRNGLLIGIIYFLIFLLTSYASVYAGRIASMEIRNIKSRTIYLGLSAGIICGISFTYKFWFVALIAFILIYLIENVRKPILTGFLADNVPNEILASVISAQSFYQTIITATLSILIGILADFKGIGISLFLVSLVLLTLNLLLSFSRRSVSQKN